jgi:acetylornithine deacetylase
VSGRAPVAELLARLVAIDSTNPDLVPGGAGEGAVAAFIAERLARGPFEVESSEILPGRPNVVARLRGRGGGRSLLICGHTDVVGADREAFAPRIGDGRLYGRGSFDMKGGLAAAIVASERVASGETLRGDLLLAFVIDEEWRSVGAEALVERHRADAAILPEPTDLGVVVAHGGFAWYEVMSEGVEAPGGDAHLGVDAISLLGPVLAGIAELDRALAGSSDGRRGRSSIHASTVAGGVTYPSYPRQCTLGIERCLLPGESVDAADREIERLLEAAHRVDSRFRGGWKRIIGREAVELDVAEPIVTTLVEAAGEVLRTEVVPRFEIGWMDSGILSSAGIPCVVFGPAGAGEHTPQEWVDLRSLDVCADVLERTIRAFCA